MAEEGTDSADVPFGDELADAAGGDWLVADGFGGVDPAGEAEFAAEGFEIVHVAFGVVAEAEVFSFVEFDDVEGFVEDFSGEGSGGHLREIFGEGNDDDCVESGSGEELELFGERGD